jgi:hypothetical protein
MYSGAIVDDSGGPPMKRNGRLAAGLAVTAALLVPLAVFGGPALARSTSAASSQYQYSGPAQSQYRVQICHRTGSAKHPFHTITVSSAAVAAHLRHGDHTGPCTGGETPKPHGNGNGNDNDTVTTEDGQGHGNGHGHGHG